MKRGILLINVGTPNSPAVKDVETYLKQFLMDPKIISLPWIFRWPLVNLIIAPKRAPFSAEKYKKIWTNEGSPLLVHTEELTRKLREKIGGVVEFAMCVGNPSVPDVLAKMQNCEEILVVPLFPQFADASTGAAMNLVNKFKGSQKISFAPAFYDNAAFLNSWASIYRDEFSAKAKPDHILFTFHGLPEKQIQQSSFCELNSCCAEIVDKNKNCYRAQCFATARLLAQKLELKPGSWSMSFQSRLGRGEWIKPYTEIVLKELAKKGVKNLAVLCPAFTADCLETIEEIGMEGAAIFRAHGGDGFTLVPCLNSHDSWVEALADIVSQSL